MGFTKGLASRSSGRSHQLRRILPDRTILPREFRHFRYGRPKQLEVAPPAIDCQEILLVNLRKKPKGSYALSRNQINTSRSNGDENERNNFDCIEPRYDTDIEKLTSQNCPASVDAKKLWGFEYPLQNVLRFWGVAHVLRGNLIIQRPATCPSRPPKIEAR